MRIPLDVIGDIAILKFSRETKQKEKKEYALKLLKENKNLKTILEKIGKFSGRLRKPETKFLAGIDKKETFYKENDCTFYLNVDETYFSPRLSYERKKISEEILKETKKNPNILVMFAGVAPFPIVLAKIFKKANKKCSIISSELNRKATEYAKKNVELNKLFEYITVIQGDSKKIPEKLKRKFDIISMPRPNLKDTFLDSAFKCSKKGTQVYYYGFGTEESVKKEIEESRKKSKKKIKIIYMRQAGDIGPRKHRYLVKFKILK